MLILANYFWFLNITLSSKTWHQFGLNQPTDMFDHSTESWEQGEEDRTWAGGLRRLWRPNKTTKYFTAKFSGHGCSLCNIYSEKVCGTISSLEMQPSQPAPAAAGLGQASDTATSSGLGQTSNLYHHQDNYTHRNYQDNTCSSSQIKWFCLDWWWGFKLQIF